MCVPVVCDGRGLRTEQEESGSSVSQGGLQFVEAVVERYHHHYRSTVYFVAVDFFFLKSSQFAANTLFCWL